MVSQENKGMESSTNYKLYKVSITFIQRSIALHVTQQNVQKYLLYLAVLSLFRFLVCLCIQQIQYEIFFKQACFHPFGVSNMFTYSLLEELPSILLNDAVLLDLLRFWYFRILLHLCKSRSYLSYCKALK